MATWSEAFTAYLRKLGLSQSDAHLAMRRARIRVSPSQVSYYCRGARPREALRQKIQRWSRGDVPANLPARAPTSSTNHLEDTSLHRQAG
jgi:hypothetical protein